MFQNVVIPNILLLSKSSSFCLGERKTVLANKSCRSTSLQYTHTTLHLKLKAVWDMNYVLQFPEETAPSCFYRDVGGSMFTWNTGTYLADNTVSHPKPWSNNEHCNKLSFHHKQMHCCQILFFFLKILYKCCVSENIHFSVLPESSAHNCITSIHSNPCTAQ